MGPLSQGERAGFLSTRPAGSVARRLALQALIISGAAFAVALPFARVPLPPVVAFVGICESAIVLNNLITATLLFGQFAILGTVSLVVLGAGFLLAALLAGLHLLLFPGVFTPTGLFGAQPQTAPWAYLAWHTALAAAVLAYASLTRARPTLACAPEFRSALIAAGVAGAMVATLVVGVTATRAHAYLPALIADDRYTPVMTVAVTAVALANVAALWVLWRRRPHSVLDLWIMVAICAGILEVALASALNAGRYDVGFYAGRIYGLVASSVVLLALLLENSVLYARLVRTVEGERNEFRRTRHQSVELHELNASLERRVAARTAELAQSNRELRAEATHRERAEFNAREARERLDGIIDSAMDAIITVGDDQRIVLFNTAAEAMFECPQAEAIGTPLAQFIPARHRDEHAEHVRHFGEVGVRSRRMARQRIVAGVRRSGEEFPIDASISQVALGGRRYYTVIVRDVTQRMEADAALRRSQTELHEIAMASSNAREQEKQRIARELHDELAQSLAMLGMDLTWLRGRLTNADAAQAAKIDAMQKLVTGTVAATRRIAAELRPLVLDDLGLVPALHWLVEKFGERHGIACAVVISPAGFDIGDPHATAIFRITQEALANVARHARATHVTIALEQDEAQVTLGVEDDGCGFDLAETRKAASFGLVGLRERARLVDANLRIRSAPGRGTRIDVAIPMRAPSRTG